MCTNNSISRHNHRVARIGNQFSHLLELVLRRTGCTRALHLQRWHIGSLLIGNVLGEIYKAAAGFFVLRILESLAHNLVDNIGAANLGAVLGNRLEQIDQIEDLVAFLVQAFGRTLPGNTDNRSPVHVGIGKAGDQVGGTRPQRRKTDTGLAGEPPVDIGHERRTLLVTRGNKADGTGEQSIHHGQVLLAGNTKDLGDALVFQALDKFFCAIHGLPPRVYVVVRWFRLHRSTAGQASSNPT